MRKKERRTGVPTKNIGDHGQCYPRENGKYYKNEGTESVRPKKKDAPDTKSVI